jgi:hypothetical protein
LPTGDGLTGAAGGGHGAAGGGGGAKVDAWTRRLSLAVHPARLSLAAVLGVNLEDGEDDGDGDGSGGDGAVSGTPLAHRIACLQTCVKRLEEQLCIVQVDRDAAHKQQAGYVAVLAAKDQQVVALRMQLRMARDQMTKPSKLPRPSAIAASPITAPGPRLTITAFAPITAPELAPSSQPPSTVTSAHASTVASPIGELPPPADAPWRAASTPTRIPTAEGPHASPHAPPHAPPPPPPPPRLPPTATVLSAVTSAHASTSSQPPTATVLSALAAGGVSAAALAALSSADLAIIEARAVESSGLRAEVLKATHERCAASECPLTLPLSVI